MRIKIIILVIISMIVLNTIILPGDFVNKNPLDGGWLEVRNGVKILHQSGNHYEMGYQHGFLLQDEFNENMRAVKKFNERRGYNPDELYDIWNQMESYIPIEYIEELQGMVDGANVSFKEVACFFMSFEVNCLMDCFGIVAMEDATIDGDLIHVRSFDQQSSIIDPISGKKMIENSVLIVRNPDDGYSSINPTIAGRINGGGGFNEMGIAYGNIVSWSEDQTFNGTNFLIRGQNILDYAATIDDSIKIISENRSLGWNYVLSDSKIPTAYIIESSANQLYIGEWDDPIESISPFWKIENIIRRTNFYIHPDLASSQRNRYHPGGFIGFIELLIKTLNDFILKIDFENKIINSVPLYSIFRNYNIISKELEKKNGNLNLSNTLDIMRRVYSGKADPILAIMRVFGEGHGFLESCNLWSANPESGDILISFADDKKTAQFNEIHSLNLFELLNSEPP